MTMSDKEVQLVYQHVVALYSGNNQDNSSLWLSEFSKTIEAWSICDRMLGERKDSLACYFAAQTIRQKILKSLKEIPPETYLPLRDSLIHHLSLIIPTPGDNLGETTITQICLSIADLYIQVPEWNNWIVELLNKCTTLEGDRTHMMLTLLRVFPEEIRTIRIGENRRKVLQNEIAASAKEVCDYLTITLQRCSSDQEVVKKILNCLAAYLSNPAINSDHLVASPLMEAAFEVMAHNSVASSLHDAAAECIVEASIMVDNKLEAHAAFVAYLQRKVFALAEPFNVTVAHEELDKLQNYARVFTELCETLLEKLVNELSSEMDSLGSAYAFELLLLLAGHHDYSLIEKTFNMWYRISEALFIIEDEGHIAKFKPYVNRYLSALYRHSRFDTDEEGIPDEDSDFMNFRLKVTETVKDVVYIVGTDKCVRSMCEMLVACSANNGTWDEMEAALFIISAVVHNIHPSVDDEDMIPQLINSITSLPVTAHPCLIETSVKLLAGCNEYFEKKSVFLDPVVRWLTNLIPNPLFSASAAETLVEIVGTCSTMMVNNIPNFLQFLPLLETANIKSKQVENTMVFLLRCCAIVVNHLDFAQAEQTIMIICDPIMKRMNSILHDGVVSQANKENEKQSDSWARLAEDPLLWVDRIAAIFKELRPIKTPVIAEGSQKQIPWMNISSPLVDFVTKLLIKNEAQGRMVEHCCRALRYIVRSLGFHSHNLIWPIVEQIVQVYIRHPHSCLLYLVSIFVDEYGHFAELRPHLIHLLDVFSTATFAYLGKDNNVSITMRDNPEFVEDLFRLANRYILKCPSEYFVCSSSAKLFECGLIALKLDHVESNRSVTKFFLDIINQLLSAKKNNYFDNGVAAAKDLIDNNGDRLTFHTLEAALFGVSGNLRRDLAEILGFLARYDRTLHRQWLEKATARLPRTALGATDAQLCKFVDSITGEDAKNARDVYNQIRDLGELYH